MPLFSKFRFTISRKITLMLVMTVVLVSGSVMGFNMWRANKEAEAAAYEAIDRNMRVAWKDLECIGTTYRIEGDKLMANNTALNDLNSVPDSTVAQVGGERNDLYARYARCDQCEKAGWITCCWDKTRQECGV